MSYALYRTNDRTKILWSGQQNANSQIFHELFQKFRRFLKMRHPSAVLENVIDVLDDIHLHGSNRWDAAYDLLRIVFLHSGYDLVMEMEEL